MKSSDIIAPLILELVDILFADLDLIFEATVCLGFGGRAALEKLRLVAVVWLAFKILLHTVRQAILAGELYDLLVMLSLHAEHHISDPAGCQEDQSND